MAPLGVKHPPNCNHCRLQTKDAHRLAAYKSGRMARGHLCPKCKARYTWKEQCRWCKTPWLSLSIDEIIAQCERINGCLIFPSWRGRTKYQMITVDGTRDYAHRLVWKSVHGEIPQGLEVCHKCDNPPCLDVEHYFLGTQRDNIQDAARKGRLRFRLLGRKQSPEHVFNKALAMLGHKVSKETRAKLSVAMLGKKRKRA
jgi:hypothetical protein